MTTPDHVITAANQAGFNDKQRSTMTYESGPYDITKPTCELEAFYSIAFEAGRQAEKEDYAHVCDSETPTKAVHHSAELWYAVQPEHCGGWWVIAKDPEGWNTVDESADGGFEEHTAKRIVACVNACAGIPTEALTPTPSLVIKYCACCGAAQHPNTAPAHNTECIWYEDLVDVHYAI